MAVDYFGYFGITKEVNSTTLTLRLEAYFLELIIYTFKNDKKEILMLLKYLPMSQQMNNSLYDKYLDQILTKQPKTIWIKTLSR